MPPSSSAKRTVHRFKTAIRRFQPSRPVSLAWEHGFVQPGATVLDYGCGHGDDIRHLAEQGVEAVGWDPHYQPDTPVQPADVVNLGYVLNVIENPGERAEVLRRALALARRLLVVSVRVDRGPQTAETYGDGLVTSRLGFQKIFTQAEFRTYVESVTGAAPTMAALGIAYVFKDPSWESHYLARASVYRPRLGRRSAIAAFEASELGQEYLSLARALARLPRPREFPYFHLLREQFGSPQRITRLARAVLDPSELQRLRGEKRDDFLVYYAATRLQGAKLPRFSLLPEEVQADILAIWSSYKLARDEGEQFLFSLGDAERVQAATRESGIGKYVVDSLYVHRSAEDQLPALSRLQIFAARQIVGDQPYEILKISADGRKVSFLSYPEFDQVAHPSLVSALSVYLPKADYSYREYSATSNPPILHRKDALVDETYPLHQKFKSLTAQEDKRSLLSRPDIGHRESWERVLAEAGYQIQGHRLLRRK